MGENIYLIRIERAYEDIELIGYIKGTEKDAEKYCEEYNEKIENSRDSVWYEELEKLN